ncbi:MAG: SMP-30/gluconolactonase/LRE family protein [Caulobacterales bacterium]
MDFTIVAEGLRYPDGPIVQPDGALLVAETAGGAITRLWPSYSGKYKSETVADLGGGPTGAALGKDSALYVCNNAGSEWIERHGRIIPVGVSSDYAGGRVERVDLSTGKIETLFDHCGDHALRAPKDIVFDREGGFWFADSGRTYARMRDHGGLYYVVDGEISEAVYPLLTPCGVGLSADEKTLYVSDTLPGRLWAYTLAAPGQIASDNEGENPGRLVCTLPGEQPLDSLALDSKGNVCVATGGNGGITVFTANGLHTHRAFPDLHVSNICFGGADMRDAYITLASVGQVIKTRWPESGMRLNFGMY